MRNARPGTRNTAPGTRNTSPWDRNTVSGKRNTGPGIRNTAGDDVARLHLDTRKRPPVYRMGAFACCRARM
ncbi:hypothetical protein LY13_003490 [Prauserella aidingensis]|nr:hypothetical protein [Prauserella aidingensis]